MDLSITFPDVTKAPLFLRGGEKQSLATRNYHRSVSIVQNGTTWTPPEIA